MLMYVITLGESLVLGDDLAKVVQFGFQTTEVLGLE